MTNKKRSKTKKSPVFSKAALRYQNIFQLSGISYHKEFTEHVDYKKAQAVATAVVGEGDIC